MNERVNYQQPPSEELSLHDYLVVLKRRRWTVAVVFGAAFFSAAAYSVLAKPVYRASTTVQIEEKKGPTFSLAQVAEQPLLGMQNQSDQFLTEEEIIRSRTVVEKVVDRLRLEKDLKPEMGESLDAIHQRAVQRLQEKLDISRLRNTNILKISLEDHDPEKAARIINTLTDEYIGQNLMLSRREASQARDFVGKQLPEIRKELEARENALEKMKSSKGIVTLDDNVKSALDRLTDVEQRRAVMKMQREGLETLLASLQQKGDDITIPPVLTDNPSIASLAGKWADLQIQMASMLKIYSDNHPLVVSLQGSITELEGRLRQEIATGLQSLKDQEAALDQIIQQYEGQMKNLPETEKELVGVMRGLKASEGIYTFLLQKEQETKIAEASEVEHIRVVDPALAPLKPVKPRKLLNLLLGAIIGMMGGVGLAFFREYLDNTVRSPEEAERATGLPVYGCIYQMAPQPAAAADEKRNPYAPYLVTVQNPTVVEAYKLLRTNIDFMRADQKVLLITSAAPGEGKSLTVANMAVMFGTMGLKILVIDADLRNPSQHTVFGLTRKPGLSDVLAGKAPWLGALQQTSFEGVRLLSSGSSTPSSAELLTGKPFEALLADMKPGFDLIMIDGPPAGFSDVVILSTRANRLFFVVEAGKTAVRDIIAAKQALVHSKAPIAGLILNKASGEEIRYHYYYHYYHRGEPRPTRYRRWMDRVKRAVGKGV